MSRTIMRHAKIGAWMLVAVAVATSPITVSAASSTADTTVNATVNDVISISSGPTVAISLTPTSGGVVSSASDTVSVSTNRTTGYTLTMKDADTSSNLVSGGNNITPHTGTPAAPTALANGTWGYAVAGGNFDATYAAESNAGSSTTKWAGVPTSSGSAVTLKTTATTASADTTTVWYAAKVNTSQAGGTYTDTVRYTATTN